MKSTLWLAIAILGGIALALVVHSSTDSQTAVVQLNPGESTYHCNSGRLWSAREDRSTVTLRCDGVAATATPTPTPTLTPTPTPTAPPTLTPTPSPQPTASPTPAPPSTVACFTIEGQRDRVYENLTVGPCPDRAGIFVRNSQNITLRNVTVSGAKTNIEVFQSSGVHIDRATLRNPQGPFPRGQQVLFDHSSGSLRNSTLTFVTGFQEDAVNLWYSHDVLIEGNNISGNSSRTGCGVLLHYGTTRITVRGNEIHHIQCGIGIAGGTMQVVDNNNVHDYWGYNGSANIGIYLWNQSSSGEPCDTIRVTNNRVSPGNNPWWNAGNCTNVVWTGNTVY